MKTNVLLAAAAVAVLGFAGVANAAPQTTVDVNLSYSDLSQLVSAKLDQTAKANMGVQKIAGAVDNSATNVGNTADVTAKIGALGNVNSIYEGSGALADVTQRVTAAATQNASATLTGLDVTAKASNAATNAANAASVANTIK